MFSTVHSSEMAGTGIFLEETGEQAIVVKIGKTHARQCVFTVDD